MTLQQMIETIWSESPEIYTFRSEADKAKIIQDLERKFSLSGNTIAAKNTGAALEDGDFTTIIYNHSSQYLRVKGRGRYIPMFCDSRSTDERVKHKQETEKVVDFLFEKMGLVFRGEHVNDSTVRNLVRGSISENFLFEAGDENGEIVFRKYSDGMFSKTFTPREVIDHFTSGVLDHKRTNAKQDELKSVIKKKEAERMGDKLTPGQLAQLNTRIEEAFEQTQKAYTRRILPLQREADITTEFTRRALFKMGLPNAEAATLQQKNFIASYAAQKVDALNSLPDIPGDLKNYRTPPEDWGIKPENTSGYFLPTELL